MERGFETTTSVFERQKHCACRTAYLPANNRYYNYLQIIWTYKLPLRTCVSLPTRNCTETAVCCLTSTSVAVSRFQVGVTCLRPSSTPALCRGFTIQLQYASQLCLSLSECVWTRPSKPTRAGSARNVRTWVPSVSEFCSRHFNDLVILFSVAFVCVDLYVIFSP
jgi:hypothetical protein